MVQEGPRPALQRISYKRRHAYALHIFLTFPSTENLYSYSMWNSMRIMIEKFFSFIEEFFFSAVKAIYASLFSCFCVKINSLRYEIFVTNTYLHLLQK